MGPNAPKKPQTAYLYFSTELRPKLKKENPALSFGELGKLVGSKYKELTEDDKEKYNDMAKADKERYKKEMASYEQKKKSEAEDSDSDDDDEDSDEELVADDS